MELKYASIESQLIETLPELRPAAETYWREEGEPGSDSGPYIFYESMFACYVSILLSMPDRQRRTELLKRSFEFVELMLAASDIDIRNLAGIALFEGRPAWWFNRAKPFLGLNARSEIKLWYEPKLDLLENDMIERDFIDLYEVRSVVAFELQVSLLDVPGVTVDEGD